MTPSLTGPTLKLADYGKTGFVHTLDHMIPVKVFHSNRRIRQLAPDCERNCLSQIDTRHVCIYENMWKRGEAISYTAGFRQSKTAHFDWTFFRLDSSGPSYRQSSRFFSFRALPRACWCEGILLYCGMAVENRLAALGFARSM